MTRRQQLDRKRYLRHREERLKHWREYYRANRERILQRKREAGFLTYGTNKRNYERREQNTTAGTTERR
jgi:hypothetical protein